MSGWSAPRWFWHALWVTLLAKLALAQALPITGDEAYFILWGRHPDLGYYDHPPLVGWLLSLLLVAGDAQVWLRLPAVLLNSAIALLLMLVLRPVAGTERAALGGLLYLLAPVNLINVLVTTDTPLIFCALLSILALQRAVAGGSRWWFVLSGALLGLAFLAKYFAVLLGLAYAAYLLGVRRDGRAVQGLGLILLGVLPSAALNLWWNHQHCWDNVLFNLYTRHTAGSFDWQNPALYAVSLVYLATPPLLYHAWRARGAFTQALRQRALPAWMTVIAGGLFALLSLKARVGLHWLLAFYPFLFLALTPLLDGRALRGSVRFMAVFGVLHLAAITVVLALPYDVWRKHPVAHHDLVFGSHTAEFLAQIEPRLEGYALATESYVYSSMLEYRSGRRVHVFGTASKHGRQDDLLTDFRSLEGRNIAVLVYAEKSVAEHGAYFERYEVYPVTVRGVTDYLLLGQGFRYAKYREEVLRHLAERYYRLPWFLPAGTCYFYQRYFPDEDIPRLPRP